MYINIHAYIGQTGNDHRDQAVGTRTPCCFLSLLDPLDFVSKYIFNNFAYTTEHLLPPAFRGLPLSLVVFLCLSVRFSTSRFVAAKSVGEHSFIVHYQLYLASLTGIIFYLICIYIYIYIYVYKIKKYMYVCMYTDLFCFNQQMYKS